MRRWMQSSLQRKLSVLIVLSMIVPMLLLGVFAFTTAARVTEEKARLSGMDTLSQMNNNLSFIIRDVENISLFMISQQEIQRYMSSREEDGWMRAEIIGLLANLAASKKYIADLSIYAPKFDTTLSTSSVYSSDLLSQIDLEHIKNKYWTPAYSLTNASGKQQVITFIRPLRSTHDYRKLGWLSISLNEQVLSSYWTVLPHKSDSQGQVWLVDKTGNILSGADYNWSAISPRQNHFDVWDQIQQSGTEGNRSGSLRYGTGEEEQTVLYQRNAETGWTLVMMIPSEQYLSQNRFILQLTFGAVLVAVMISAALIWLVVSRIIRPLRHLTGLLYHSDPSLPLPEVKVESMDEIGRLGCSYNRFGAHIARLKQQLIRQEARKKEADLRALEAQIHPHFMYNTLSSIQWIALMSGERKIGDMVQGLSDFLRLSLNQGRDHCSVEQELEHIRNYMQVQRIRFPDKVNMSWMIDPSLRECTMLKLLLQPLVENALIHGIQPKEGTGTITIHLERSDWQMHFMVLDDGIGIEPKKLEQIRQQLRTLAGGREDQEQSIPLSGQGYGLYNVNERLYLYYGTQACLHIDSQLHKGTKISFSIPIKEEPHENLNCG